MGATLGTGTTLAFGTSTFSVEITDVQWGDQTREAINSSHLGTTNDHTFIPASLVDHGEVSFTYHYDGTDDVDALIAAAAETVTITDPSTSTSNAFSAFCVGHRRSYNMEDKMTGEVRLKVTGAITQDITP